MIKVCRLQLLLVAFSAILISVPATGYVPDIYQDEYVTVRAAVMETEHQPIHFGDELTLIIQVVFRNSEVLIEDLDEEFFRKNWGSEKGVSLIGTPLSSSANRSEGYTEMTASYSFQIIDCPGELTSCSGHKIYEVPVFSLGYQIIDGSGDVQNNKSVRFQPWPGNVALTQALHIRDQPLEEFSSYFPGGAYPEALIIDTTVSGSLWLTISGGILLLAGFTPLLFSRRNVTSLADPGRKPERRWEQVLLKLQDNSVGLPDEQWADHLRRCVTWYALDELGVNPYTSLDEDSASIDKQLLDSTFRSYFLDVVNQESIAANRRIEFINRFLDLAGLSYARGSRESIA